MFVPAGEKGRADHSENTELCDEPQDCVCGPSHQGWWGSCGCSTWVTG